MSKFRMKSPAVDAVVFSPGVTIAGLEKTPAYIAAKKGVPLDVAWLPTDDGGSFVHPGDVVITHESGRLEVMKKEDFDDIYEPAPEPAPADLVVPAPEPVPTANPVATQPENTPEA